MQKRFISIWFRYLKTDWFTRRHPHLKETVFVLALPERGRLIITATSAMAKAEGIYPGMAVADARALIPSLQVLDDKPSLPHDVLTALAEWSIRYTPVVAIDLPDGILLDVTGCAHLWGGEKQYLSEIIKRFTDFGYGVQAAMADTIGAAWAVARFANASYVIETGKHSTAILSLPAIALRLEPAVADRLQKLGLNKIRDFISMPRSALRRRFGTHLLKRIDETLGNTEETMLPVMPLEPFHERLPCIEPIVTATGIEIALQRLLEILCRRLQQEEKGLRIAVCKGYRLDGKIEQIEIGTNRPSCNSKHLFKLFEIKINTIEPATGIELFTLDALKVEHVSPAQEKLWSENPGLDNSDLSELLDRIEGKIGTNKIHRYVPDEHYWPERSFKRAQSLDEVLKSNWQINRPRPMQLLARPSRIEVTAPIPDYPPMMFRYNGKLHKIKKADGPERIEQEWWLQNGQHRDYYIVENEAGERYWLFRSGHYDVEKSYQWFIHGFFA